MTLSNPDKTELKQIKDTLSRIEMGLFGDEKAGVTGIVNKVRTHEKKIQYIERIIYGAIGAGSIISILWAIFKEVN